VLDAGQSLVMSPFRETSISLTFFIVLPSIVAGLRGVK
jgi:hypothetical protein